MQDRSPPTRRNLLATHGRTIHLGQKRTYALQQNSVLLDHLVGAGEHLRWDGDTKRLGGPEVND